MANSAMVVLHILGCLCVVMMVDGNVWRQVLDESLDGGNLAQDVAADPLPDKHAQSLEDDLEITIKDNGHPSIMEAPAKRSQPAHVKQDYQHCSHVCHFCKNVLSTRWAALCFAQCDHGGRAYDACLTVWSYKTELFDNNNNNNNNTGSSFGGNNKK